MYFRYKEYKPTEEEGKKAVADLLIEQVEFANVIILNKVNIPIYVDLLNIK